MSDEKRPLRAGGPCQHGRNAASCGHMTCEQRRTEERMHGAGRRFWDKQPKACGCTGAETDHDAECAKLLPATMSTSQRQRRIEVMDLPKEEREGIDVLVTSLASKLPFTAPEMVQEKVRIYVETAWLRGRNAGLDEARKSAAWLPSGAAGGEK